MQKRNPTMFISGDLPKWGNPFSHKPDTKAKWRVSTREEAIHKYEEWIQTQPHLMASLHELKGKVLGVLVCAQALPWGCVD